MAKKSMAARPAVGIIATYEKKKSSSAPSSSSSAKGGKKGKK